MLVFIYSDKELCFQPNIKLQLWNIRGIFVLFFSKTLGKKKKIPKTCAFVALKL